MPERGVTGYANDGTQGPACALACAPGTVYRNYFAPTRTVRVEGTVLQTATQTGQTRDAQLNNLADVEALLDNARQRYFTVRNGYLMADDAGLARLNQALAAADRDTLLAALRVGSVRCLFDWARAGQPDPRRRAPCTR